MGSAAARFPVTLAESYNVDLVRRSHPQYSCIDPGTGRAASTGLMLSRWSALGRRLGLTGPLAVIFSALWARSWLNYNMRLLAEESSSYSCWTAAPLPLRDAGTRAGALDEYLAHSNEVVNQVLLYLAGDAALMGPLLPAIRANQCE